MKYINSEYKNGFIKTHWKVRLGMEGEGDMENEWLSPEEIAKKRKLQEEYITELKRTGDYGKEVDWTIEIEDDRTFDTFQNKSTESYSMQIIDFSNLPETKPYDPYEGLSAEEKIDSMIKEKRIEESWKNCSPYDK